MQYVHTILRMALGYAERYELIVRNPAALVRTTKARTDPTRVFGFTRDQAVALLDAARGDRHEAFYTVAIAVGLRRGEALGLRWADIDLDTGTLRVEQQVQRIRGVGLIINPLPKTKSSRRTILLPTMCTEALRAHRTRQLTERLACGEYWHDHDLVFASTLGTPLCPASSSWQDFFGLKGGCGRVCQAEVNLGGPVPGEGFVRADRVVLDAVVLGSLGELDGVVDLVDEQPLVLQGAEPAFA